jgi:hypothetical protein
MWFSSWSAKWQRIAPGSRTHASRRRRLTAPPQAAALESLEDRVLLSAYTAATAAALIADIKAANTAGGANTITLIAPTTSPYVLTAPKNAEGVTTGLPTIAAKDNLTIVGNSDTIERSTASGTPAFRLFDVASGGSLTLQYMTLQGGYCGSPHSFSLPALAAQGGAIYNLGALTLNGVTVADNQADAASGGTASGGAIYSNGSLTLENGTLLQGNSALGGYGQPGYVFPGSAFGGAVYVAGGTANISNTSFTGNSVRGGEYNSESNSGAGASGGALYVAAGQVTLTNSTVNNNWAGHLSGYQGSGYPGFGGGLYIAGGTVSLSGDTVDSNYAGLVYGDGYGAGLYIAAGTVTLTDDTVEYNGANGGQSAGGGLLITPEATVYIDPFTLANIINNTAVVDPNIDGTYIET